MTVDAENRAANDAQLAALLGRCARADGEALRSLYERVSPILFALLVRMLRRRAVAEEALQDVFVTVWQRADQYRPERGRALAWIIAIARYRAIDLLRRERFAPEFVPQGSDDYGASSEHVDEGDSWAPGTELFEHCFSLLAREQRKCLELAFVAGSSQRDIARIMNSPLGTVKSWIRRGLQSLRTCFES
jgi:RNA polymerase sigma-70 factor (ECF subfamily)